MKRALAAAATACLLIAGCGGTSRTIHAGPPVPSPNARCANGQSFLGCSLSPEPFMAQVHRMQTSHQPRQGAPLAPPTVSRGLFPDVSMWQGRVDWGAVKAWQLAHGWQPAGIFKMGEGTSTDPWAAVNAAQLHQLGMWTAGYEFVRNVGCGTEAAAIEAHARQFGIRVVELDLEVPEAAGYGLCLTPRLRATGLLVGEYTAPGTNPGGVDVSAPLWQATYGQSFNPIWQPVVAWQCTDGQFGCVTFVPGIGTDDVSVDLGITRIGVTPPPPPDPYGIFLNTGVRLHGRTVNEYLAVKRWDALRCANPVKRPVCADLRFDLELAAGRIHALVRSDRRHDWFFARRHRRFADLVLRITLHGRHTTSKDV